ncbi:hypothetical protein ACF0H5_001693 [Mactra antiquata]
MNPSLNSSDIQSHFLVGEAVLAIVVQLIGVCLILSSIAMFIKHASLHKVENALQMNLLLSSAVFLFIDWTLTLPGNSGCDVFSMVFLVSGTACTYTTTGIAIMRFKKMMRITYNISAKISTAFSILTIWILSLLCMVYPITLRLIYKGQSHGSANGVISVKMINKGRELIDETMCFFSDGILYKNAISGLCFILGGILIPVIILAFVYIKIYCKVKKARINRWLNHVATQRSQQTTIIRLQGRKANVFQISSNNMGRDMLHISRPSQMNKRCERSVFRKGLFAVLIVLCCWVPFSGTWLYLAMGFNNGYTIYFRYLMVIAKTSVIFNIMHYVCFNIKYRRLYIQTARIPFTNGCRLLQDQDTADDNSRHLDSHIVSYATSNVDKPILTLPTNTVLTPISENPSKNHFEKDKEVVKSRNSSNRRKKSSIKHHHCLQRSASFP